MTTLAHDITRWIADQWERAYPSAVMSGIVGDLAHRQRGGYHISIVDQPSTNYSVVRVDDKAPPGTWRRDLAAAIDMSLSLADLKRCHLRLRAVFNDPTDPRRRYLNAFNGWDGVGDAGRYDIVSGTVSYATPDHKWHEHAEIRRRWVADWTAARAIVSILTGQTKAQYLAGTDTSGEDDMALTDKLTAGTGKGKTVEQVLNALLDAGAKGLPIPDLGTLPDGTHIPAASYSRDTRLTWAHVHAFAARKAAEATLAAERANAAADAARDAAMTTAVVQVTALTKQLLDLVAAGGGDPDVAAIVARLDALPEQVRTAAADAGRAEADRILDRLAAAQEAGAEELRGEAAHAGPQ